MQTSSESRSFEWWSPLGAQLQESPNSLRQKGLLVENAVVTATTKIVPRKGLLVSIALISLSILVQQIALTRLLSVVLWYHFAFLAISLAMLGLALGGVALYLRPSLLRESPRLVPAWAMIGALTSLVAVGYVSWVPLDLTGGHATIEAATLYVALLVPFVLAGLGVSAILAYHSESIGPLYAADLLGAALGCVIVVPLLDSLGAPSAIVIGALCCALGGTAYLGSVTGWGQRVGWVLVLGVAAAQLFGGLLEPTAMHGIADTAASKGQEPDFVGWNSHSRIVVSPESEWGKQINIDGHATTGAYRFDVPVTRASVAAQLPWMPLRGGSMPYVVVGDEPEVLLIGPGGGLDILNGVYYGATIQAVELNGLIYDLMSSGPIADWTGGVYSAPGVSVVHDEARSWLSRTDQRFDIIQASMIDTWAATASGAFSLAENSLYTVEAFDCYWDHLTDNGVVHFMRWHETPPRQSLRVLALAAESMTRAGETDIASHFVVLEEPQFPTPGHPMASLIWSRKPFTSAKLDRLEQAIKKRQSIGPVKILCWPGRELDNAMSKFLRSPDRSSYMRDYPFDISPTVDDRPFFFHTAAKSGQVHIEGGENEQAVSVLMGAQWVVLVITLLAFIVPFCWALVRGRLGSVNVAVRNLSYFAAIGVGFMCVEIPLLQRFGLYMGHPTWGLSVVLGSLLLGAGFGGMSTARATEASLQSSLRRAVAFAGMAAAVAWLCSGWLISLTIAWGFMGRVALSFTVLSGLGFVLGRALPLGVRALRRGSRDMIPWAWGINGAGSVLASVSAVVVGLEWGFSVSLFVGLCCYCLAWLAALRLVRPAE